MDRVNSIEGQLRAHHEKALATVATAPEGSPGKLSRRTRVRQGLERLAPARRAAAAGLRPWQRVDEAALERQEFANSALGEAIARVRDLLERPRYPAATHQRRRVSNPWRDRDRAMSLGACGHLT